MAGIDNSIVLEPIIKKRTYHFVLVHGVCMGAWCWYKLKSLLQDEGHTVTALDLKASGVDGTNIDDVNTFKDYNKPLFDCMKELKEPVILVGNCVGGISIAMAAEKYPERVKALVFLGAFIPDTKNPPSFIIDKFKDSVSEDFWKDTSFPPHDDKCKDLVVFGPHFLSSTLYNLSPKEDGLLASLLMRKSSFFAKDLSTLPNLTDEKYGKADRFVIIAENGPKAITKYFNFYQMENAGIDGFSFVTMDEADDMAMVSKPEEVVKIMIDYVTTSKA